MVEVGYLRSVSGPPPIILGMTEPDTDSPDLPRGHIPTGIEHETVANPEHAWSSSISETR
ncbi:hypothetical protein YT1_3934 [Rhodococcus ruber]|nr:hypothetical protein YT1_3934 [Rhodococcus ruber]